MKSKNLTAACMIIAMVTGFASASLAETEPPPECISGCEPQEKGDNGWGNGADGPNPGTDEGNAKNVSTKSNPNVPVFDLDKVDRFGGR